MKKILFLVDSYGEFASNNGNCLKKIINTFKSTVVKSYIISFGDVKKNNNNNIYFIERDNKVNKPKMLFTIKGSEININNYYKKAKEIIESEGIDTIVAIYRPTETLYAGCKLKKSYPSLELVTYFLDCVEDIFPKNKLKRSIIKHNSNNMIKYALKNSDKVFVIDSYEKYFNNNVFKIFSSKIKYLPLPLFEKIEIERMVQKSNEICIVYVGSLNEEFRNPEGLLKVISKLIKFTPHIKIKFYGEGCEEILLKYKKEMPKNIEIYGKVSKKKADFVVKNSDILLNISNKMNLQVPGKIFEYFATGKPILNYRYNEDDAANKYYNKYPVIYNINHYDNHIDYESLKNFIENSRENIVDYKTVYDLYYENSPIYTAKFLE